MTDGIRVMIVDDSTYMRYVITQILESTPGIHVVEKARDGIDALDKLDAANPDVITLDVQMPNMDGLRFLEEMRKTRRIPTIMLSSLTTEGAEDTLRALELGALDFVAKPTGIASLTLNEVGEDLIRKVQMAASIKKETIEQKIDTASHEPAPPGDNADPEAGADFKAGSEPEIPPAPSAKKRTEKPKPKSLKRVVAIACSTGGPRALGELIPSLPPDLDACVIVAQHMPAAFTGPLADRLNGVSEIQVREASHGDKIEPGVVYIAPGDYHLCVEAGDTISINQEPPRHGVRPCADIMMESVARIYGPRGMAVVLTGMGTDGAQGAKALKEVGGYVIAEHENSCVVYGMPRAVVAAGVADRVLMLQLIAEAIVKEVLDS